MDNLKNKIIPSFIIFLGLVFAYSARAERMKLSPFSINFGGSVGDIAGFVVNLYKFLVGIAGIAAVGMIVAGGVLYATSSVVNKKGEGLDMIKSAVIGIILLLGSYVIIITINPNLLKLGTLSLPECPATSDGKGADPGRNCLPKIVPPFIPVCSGGEFLIDEKGQPTTVKEVRSGPDKNCKDHAVDCSQEAVSACEGVFNLENKKCDDWAKQFFPSNDPDITETNAGQKIDEFCADKSAVLENLCFAGGKCEYKEAADKSEISNCGPRITNLNDGSKNYSASYTACMEIPGNGDEKKQTRIKKYLFYGENQGAENAQCLIWSTEELITDTTSPNYGKWIIIDGGKTPDGFKPC